MPDKELLERVEDRLVTEEAAYLDVMEHGSSISTLHKMLHKLYAWHSPPHFCCSKGFEPSIILL